eukprot:1756321-Lingulodinium_polyedra.AAC.1
MQGHVKTKDRRVATKRKAEEEAKAVEEEKTRAKRAQKAIKDEEDTDPPIFTVGVEKLLADGIMTK